MQPGETITPHGNNEETAPRPTPPAASAVSPPQPPATDQPESTTLNPLTSTEPDIGALATPQANNVDMPGALSWTASEFIEHQKPAGWYLSVVVGSIVLSVLVYLLLRDIFTVVVVALAALMFAVVGARRPRSLAYSISQVGIQVADKLFTFEDFKSFSVIEEGAMDAIHLVPLKRFMTPITLYFPPEQEDQIVNTLSAYLPYEDRKRDAIDRLMKRVRF